MRSAWILIASYLLLTINPTQAAYQQNPLLLNDSIYVSQQGIYKFDRKQREPLWSSLTDIETFEPDVVLRLKSPYRVGTTHIVMSPLEFMQRLAHLRLVFSIAQNF